MESNNQKLFTIEELALFDGTMNKPIYVAVNGIVYDLSSLSSWKNGNHFENLAGRDLTEIFNECHSGNIEILKKFPQVGILVENDDSNEDEIPMEICPMFDSKCFTAKQIIDVAIQQIKNENVPKINLIWLEATTCSGNLISLLNADYPDLYFLLSDLVNLTYNNCLMENEGEAAFQHFMNTLETEFILVVEGSVSLKSNGLYNVIARYNGNLITGMDAVKMAGEKAKYVLSVGACACWGGVSAARPNPSESISVPDYLERPVIRLPGCPCHPDWAIGTIANLIAFGMPELDELNRPLMFYSITVHDRCTRRSYFDSGIFAEKLGDPECMFSLGCRGPVTKADCPVRQWNGYVNWPVKDNTPCIGCAGEGFPDAMEPFVSYK